MRAKGKTKNREISMNKLYKYMLFQTNSLIKLNLVGYLDLINI